MFTKNGVPVIKITPTGAGAMENNENFEFVRIMEQFSKMDAATMKKFLEYAEKLRMAEN